MSFPHIAKSQLVNDVSHVCCAARSTHADVVNELSPRSLSENYFLWSAAEDEELAGEPSDDEDSSAEEEEEEEEAAAEATHFLPGSVCSVCSVCQVPGCLCSSVLAGFR